MPLDDRDLKFEKTLSRHLRAACPDGETLAAFHERALDAEEMVRCKKHISACAACQEILGHLQAMETLVPAGEPEIAGLAGQSERAAQQAKAGESRVREMPRRILWLHWAAPAGAIAAALLVWIALRETKQPALVPQHPTRVAEERAPAAPLSSAAKTKQPETAAKAAVPPKKLESAARETNPAEETAQTSGGPARLDKLAVSQSPQVSRKRESVSDQARLPAAIAQDAAKEKNLPSEAPALAGNEPVAPTNQQVVVSEAAPPAPEAVRKESARDERKSNMAGGAVSAATRAESTSSYQRHDLLRTSQFTAANLILSRGGKVLWRIGENGAIERSMDKGLRWEAQSSGVTAALTAGSSPTEKICWVVGKTGTILRTVDGGEHWEKVFSPISSDLGTVQAEDALRARIWDAARELSYETSDGGATWNKVAGR